MAAVEKTPDKSVEAGEKSDVQAPDKAKTGKKPVKVIWQSPRGPNAKVKLFTLQEIDVATGRLKVSAIIKPNHAGQYVLEATAQMYEQQLEAMKGYAEKYGLIPIGVKDEGLIPKNVVILPDLNVTADEEVSSLKAALLDAQNKNAELVKKLAAGEKDTADA